MEKKIEDYLHLYLGCDVLGIYGIGYLRGIDKNGWCMVTWKKNMAQGDEDFTQHDKETEIKHVKPFLRPLKSMTKEESAEYGESFVPSPGSSDTWYEYVEHGARRTHWLLSKHFDLFGLIKSGLAIDKTKHP